MIFGSRYEVDDPEFLQVTKWCDLITEGFSNGDPVSALPWLRFFPMRGLRKLQEGVKLRDPLLRRKLNEHKETFDPENIRDFTDSLIKSSSEPDFLKHCEKDNVTSDVTGVSHVVDDRLEMILFDIFIAGVETTTTTLRWLILYLLHWPSIQDELYEEIINNIGDEKRYPNIGDRSKLPLCQATIQESLRLSSLVPLGASHKTTQNTSVGGLDVPRNTQVLFNLWALHHDPTQWDDPSTFQPHRWLDEEGRYVPGRCISFLPFGAGRRVCLGESLAKTELFLFFTRFMRDFKVLPDTGKKFPGLDGRVGVTLAPLPYTVIIMPRK